MKLTRMPPVHAANLVAHSGNTTDTGFGLVWRSWDFLRYTEYIWENLQSVIACMGFILISYKLTETTRYSSLGHCLVLNLFKNDFASLVTHSGVIGAIIMVFSSGFSCLFFFFFFFWFDRYTLSEITNITKFIIYHFYKFINKIGKCGCILSNRYNQQCFLHELHFPGFISYRFYETAVIFQFEQFQHCL